MKHSVVLLDGALGTFLWEKAQQRGLERVPVWRYNLEAPQVVTQVHQAYLDAGSQILLTNTFSANRNTVAGSPYGVDRVIQAGVRLAKEASAGRARVALDIGPLPVLLEPYGDLEAQTARDIYTELIGAGMAEQPDLIFLETFMDIEMLKIAARAAKHYSVPVFCSMSFEQSGRTLMGNSVQDMLDGLTPLGVDAVGLNCSLGPAAALPVMAEFRRRTELPLLFKPNAGMPEIVGDATQATVAAEQFAQDVLPAAELGITYLGGCCGSAPSYIRRLKELLEE
ncbi:homocysteine S-methyltransferase family protein [Oscillibacter sp.]|uniref:homocysteine S-methyltransferase family protein n=1 Tax=Oscillibacter sp. TaxID=1945593 RepID=UPI002633A18C|nr:homocysteine S-methyltransferase family protein [Oscillibacter sp.]MDD3346187.1 homocysteine S-methyltransferase family protein [Oscillibacter sp.]